jgi:hypothetical protein
MNRVTRMMTSLRRQQYPGRSNTSPPYMVYISQHSDQLLIITPLDLTNTPNPKAAPGAARLHLRGLDLERPKNSRIPCQAIFVETFLYLKSRVRDDILEQFALGHPHSPLQNATSAHFPVYSYPIVGE